MQRYRKYDVLSLFEFISKRKRLQNTVRCIAQRLATDIEGKCTYRLRGVLNCRQDIKPEQMNTEITILLPSQGLSESASQLSRLSMLESVSVFCQDGMHDLLHAATCRHLASSTIFAIALAAAVRDFGSGLFKSLSTGRIRDSLRAASSQGPMEV